MMRIRLLVYSAVAIALGYVGLMLRATDGHVVPQVADLYLIAQYARAFAEGHPFRYNAGEPASSGATSLLHTAVLGAAHAVGFRGEWLIAFAIALGALCYVLTVVLAVRAARRLTGESEALLAGAMVMLCGPVVWGFLYGADTAPFMVLFLWLFERLLAGSAGGVALAGTLLALTRPEGLIVGIVVVVASRALWPTDKRARRLAALPLAAALLVLLLNRLLTGYWASTSVSDKSLFAAYGIADGIGLISDYLTDVVRGLLLGLYPSQIPVGLSQGWAPFFLPPLSLLLVIAALLSAPPAARNALRVWGVIVIGLVLLVSTNVFIGVHFNRHLMWAFPTLHVLIAAGLGEAARRWAPSDTAQQRRFFRAGAVLVVILGALSTARFAAIYGQLAGDMYRREGRAAEWISRRLPADAVIANLGTSLEYLTGRRSVNLHGVMSPAFFDNLPNEREAGTFEALGRLAPEERPSHLLTTVNNLDAAPSLRELTVLPELYRTTTFGDEILVYALRYDLADKNRRIFLPKTQDAVHGLAEVDEINVCDRTAEKAHRYQFSSGSGDLRLHGTVRVGSYVLEGAGASREEKVIDAGRAVLGAESFDIRTEAGRDVVVVMRTAADIDVGIHRPGTPPREHLQIAEAFVRVQAQGQTVGELRFKPRAGWDEVTFRIPATAVAAGKTHVELSGQYASFYYWFFQ
jgi:hypothetical protein